MRRLWFIVGMFLDDVAVGNDENNIRLAEAISQAARIKTEIGWPIIKTKTYNPKFATVIGLAMKRI